MAVDRTSELLSCLGTASSTLPTAAAARATSERGGEEVSTSGTVSSTLKNRHRRERFALEDQKSPSLSEAVLSDSDMERGTPPATFISMACSVLRDISDAQRLVAASVRAKQVRSQGIQDILDLCLQRIKVLQDFADSQCEARRAERGWFASLNGSDYSQADQHEAAIVWSLNHALCSLSRSYEAAKDKEERRLAREAKLRLAHQNALASARPRVGQDPKSSGPSIAAPITSESSFKDEFGLDDQQMQELITENDNLLREYNDMQQDLNVAQASINDIARLQSTLQEQLIYQATQIDRLFDEAANTTDTVRKANNQLGHAAGHQSASVRFFLYFVLFATFFLLLLHIISD